MVWFSTFISILFHPMKNNTVISTNNTFIHVNKGYLKVLPSVVVNGPP